MCSPKASAVHDVGYGRRVSSRPEPDIGKRGSQQHRGVNSSKVDKTAACAAHKHQQRMRSITIPSLTLSWVPPHAPDKATMPLCTLLNSRSSSAPPLNLSWFQPFAPEKAIMLLCTLLNSRSSSAPPVTFSWFHLMHLTRPPADDAHAVEQKVIFCTSPHSLQCPTSNT
ncbi:hypothetical protein DUNSADRAFT_2369 [Dunaliella salina]|uniref:Encoded protein n=1 Tax=Dunaliella salina TaxID=3046 RepID=A0ABQ7FWD2_DUNSA|nr:hypothetical protein DUNSADRAFT_2369 [Dunaliella salina]|eukprot:KAF5826683.1 hypothetical protein DUNSADRAFT_2369 [Dunaliella salina]